MKILFLDDERTPNVVSWVRYPKDSVFTIVRNAREFAATVEDNEAFDAWSLDHDLGVDSEGNIEATGYDAIQYALIAYEDKAPKEVWVHSKNPIGAANIANYWNCWRKHACQQPT